jgi:uncharacterized protein YwlG (UPF0340 family)
MDSNYVQNLWEKLRNILIDIFKKNNPKKKQVFIDAYSAAYTLVLHKHGDRLYNGTAQVVKAHLTNEVRLSRTCVVNVRQVCPEVDRAMLSDDFLVDWRLHRISHVHDYYY